MSDDTRCEPPERLRGKPGEHWVRRVSGPLAGCHDREFALWNVHVDFGGYWDDDSVWDCCTYLAPAAPPDVVRALVEALAPFANAGSIFALTDNDLGTARAALARAKDAGL